MLKLECIHYHVVFLSLHPHCTLSIYPRPLYLYHANSIPPLIYVEPSCSSMSYAHPHTTHKHIIHTQRPPHPICSFCCWNSCTCHFIIASSNHVSLLSYISRAYYTLWYADVDTQGEEDLFYLFYARWRTTMQHHALGASFHLVMFDLYVPPKTKQIWGANEILA